MKKILNIVLASLFLLGPALIAFLYLNCGLENEWAWEMFGWTVLVVLLMGAVNSMEKEKVFKQKESAEENCCLQRD